VARTATGVLSAEFDGRVRVLSIQRPEAMNALNRDVLTAIDEELIRLEVPGWAGAVVITGSHDRAFSAGADLIELEGLAIEDARAVLALGQRVMRRIERLPIATIAAVNGLALGGGFELALACSFVVASTAARFAAPETALGLIPGYGGTQRLPRAVGLPMARRLILTGERVPADRAWELGLCSEPPVAPGDLLAHAIGLAQEIAGRGPLATTLALEAMLAGAPDSAALDHELALAATAVASGEAREGVLAFREKRRARFGARG
jgi:enoyl-CoA hydratase